MPVDGINNNYPANTLNPTANALNTNATAFNTNATGLSRNTNAGNSFANLLSTYMSLSASSLGDFSSMGDSGGMGGGSMFGMGGTGGDSGLMMLMMMMLMQNQNNGSCNNMGNGILNSQCTHSYANAAYSASMTGMQQGIPTTSWLVANPSLTNMPGQRNAATYRAVMNQFNVENNERYRVNKNGTGDTYCNIFVWDVTRAMGAEIPHFVDASGNPVAASGQGITETNANSVNDWLNTHGARYGWQKVSAEQAQYYANSGMPAVTSWKNPSGHGHLQMVSPSKTGTYDPQNGVAIAQAGRLLINDGYIVDSYGTGSKLQQVEYFVHI